MKFKEQEQNQNKDQNQIQYQDENQDRDKRQDGAERASGSQEQFRVVINREAQEALVALVQRVNAGFDGGEVTKSDLVNWMLVHSTKSVSDADVKALRSLHFDERKTLGSLLKAAGDDGELPDEIKKALRDYFGLSEGSRKRSQPQQGAA